MKKQNIGIAAVFKNEHPFIIEWIAYHRLLGVKKFFIANNDSNDNTEQLLAALSDSGYIEYIDYNTEQGENPQIGAYRALAEKFKTQVDWLCYIDADEFIKPSKPGKSLARSLDELMRQPGVGAIALNWAIYGSSRWLTANSELVTKRFAWRAIKDSEINCHVKTIIKSDAYDGVGTNPHVFCIKDGYNYLSSSGRPLEANEIDIGLTNDVSWDSARVNHYVIKSRSEFLTKKRPRGRPDGDFRPLEFFHEHDLNDEKDIFSSKFYDSLEREISSINKKLTEAGWGDVLAPEVLDGVYFYEDSPALSACIDAVRPKPGKLEFIGWVTGDEPLGADFKLLLNYKKMITADSMSRYVRTDVAKAYGLSENGRYGFQAVFHLEDLEGIPADSVFELCIGMGRGENICRIFSISLGEGLAA